MNLTQKSCKACEGGIPALNREELDPYLNQINGWELLELECFKIQKRFVFKDFKEAMTFVNQVADLSEKDNHHPNVTVAYNKVDILLWTHAVEGLSENDFILAAKIDCLVDDG